MRSRTLGNTFVYAWRSLRNHWLWGDKPFRRGQAWLDMIMRASYTNHQFLVDGKPIEQKRGEFLTSIRDLGDTWGWSRTKVDRFLIVLQVNQMINYQKVQKRYTTISILNYDLYQSYEIEATPEKPEDIPEEKPDKSNRKSTEEPQKSLINKEYKGNKEDSVVTHIMKAYYLHTKDIRPWDKGKAEDFINQNPSMVTKLENAVQLKENWGKPMADIIAILKPKQAKPQDFVMSYGKIITCKLCGQSKNERDKVCKVCKNDPVLAEEVKGYKK